MIMKFECPYELEKVWKCITDLSDYAWRSDIVKIRKIDEYSFIEESIDHIETTFHITAFENGEHYAFTIDNKNMSGCWSCILKKTAQGTLVEFREDVEVKHVILKLFVKGFIKKQQAQYKLDLLNKLQAEMS